MLRSGTFSLLGLTAVAVIGCLTSCSTSSTLQSTGAVAGMSGSIHGGQQPISGATIQLYTVGTTGDGSPATPLLTAPVTSDASGNFAITGLYTCPSASALVYLVGTGGSPIASITNPQIAMMAALGPCGSLSSATFININELTTVAAVYALTPYIISFSAIGTSPANASTLALSFTYAGYLANTSTGTTPGTNLPANYSVPVSQVNTIADLLAACINSPGGVYGDGTICGDFFSLSMPVGGIVPTDTIGALLNLANNPAQNTAPLFNLIPPISPFQPTQPIVPPDFSLRLVANSAFTVAPSSLAFAPAVVYAAQSPQTITVTNGTAAAVPLTAPAITGVNFADFTISGTTCVSPLAANSTCTHQISFIPTSLGARAAYFVLANGSANPSIAIALSGTGTPGILVSLTPVSASLPATDAGSSSSVNFTLTNSASIPYDIVAFSTGNPAFTATFDCLGHIPAGGICIATVTFSPSVSGPQTGTLVIQYWDRSAIQTRSAPLTSLGRAPNLQFSSPSVNFPDTQIATTVQAQVRLFNDGDAPAIYLTKAFSLAGASQFSQTNNCPSSLPVNAFCDFIITAAPVQLGSIVANLTVSAPGSSATLSAVVKGIAGIPTNNPLVLSDSQLYVPSGGSSVITLTNSGGGPISFGPMAISAGFSQTNTCGITLAAGATCNVQLTAAVIPLPPPSTPAVTGTLTVSSNALVPVQTVALFTANPAHVSNLGTAIVGYPSPNLFTTSCSGACNVNTSIGGSNPSDFPYSGPPSCGGRGGCSVSTQFVPTAVGQRIATSTLTSNTGGGYQTLLVGTGIPATGQVTSFSIFAASIDFGTYFLGYTSPQPQTLTLTNTGNQPVPVNSISTTTSFFGGYSFPQTNTCGTSLAVGANCTITVSFSNFTGGGYSTGNLILLTYSLTPSIVIPLSANPINPQPNFTFSTTNVILAQTPAGTPSTAQTITLTNSGNVPFTVTTGPYTSGGAVFTSTTNCGTVAAGGTCTITVNATPPSVGTFAGVLPVALSLLNGGLNQNINVSVTGN